MAMGGVSIANLMDRAQNRLVDGLNFTAQNVVRAFRMLGQGLESICGGSSKVKRAKSLGPKRDNDARVTMQVDGVAHVKPVCLLKCSWFMSRSTKTKIVKLAIEAQRAALRSEGFELSKVSSDTEGARRWGMHPRFKLT